MKDRSYVLISPCRDEAKYLQRTIDSIINQSIQPTHWVIVDDGSSDETPLILERAQQKHELLQVLRLPQRSRREVGAGVIRAFRAGLASVDIDRFKYLCKLDLDVELPPAYFESLILEMEGEPRLATYSGKAYYFDTRRSRWVREAIGDDVSLAATKFYRVEAFRDIGGFVENLMWDGIDCHEARIRGWKVASSDRADLRFLHLRPMGSSDRGVLRGRRRHGVGLYYIGASPLFALASVIYRLRQRPLVVGALAIAVGYLEGMLHGERYPNRDVLTFVRKYQRLCLLLGKRRAVRLVERRFAYRWLRQHASEGSSTSAGTGGSA